MTLEIIRPILGPCRPRVALFDFDGTVSLLRSGWQQIMIDLAVEVIPRLDGERPGDVAKIGHDLVYGTNGVPTLFQMQAIVDIVRARGRVGPDAHGYKRLFLERLEERVQPRLASIESKAVAPAVWQLPSVESMLEMLAAYHIPCYLASGTDQVAVRSETAALGLERYFEGIFGATSDAENSTKATVFSRLAAKHKLGPDELVTFGDGVEEIRLTKQAEGIAIGIARDDASPGRVDADQRMRLIDAGADAIIVDFAVADQIMRHLFPPPL